MQTNMSMKPCFSDSKGYPTQTPFTFLSFCPQKTLKTGPLKGRVLLFIPVLDPLHTTLLLSYHGLHS